MLQGGLRRRTLAGDEHMKYVIGSQLHWVFASTAFAQTRYFLFPSEVSVHRKCRACEPVWDCNRCSNDFPGGVQFLVSDKSVSIPVIYQGQLPQSLKTKSRHRIEWLTEQCCLPIQLLFSFQASICRRQLGGYNPTVPNH